MNKIHGNAKDLIGQRFGRLVAVEPTEGRSGNSIVWRCFCDCGSKCFVNSNSLKRGNTKSCGCLDLDRKTTHGMSKTLIYHIWTAMFQRCENPKDPGYKYYGGRGISVCERWHTFENFYADVGDPPEGMTLDRWPNNDGDYEPSNFRWASRSQQQHNRRPNSCGPFKQRWFYGHGPNGEMILENNQRHVARIFGLQYQSISGCLRGKCKQTEGWIFQWLPN